MIPKDHIEALRTEFIRAQANFATVIQDMEAELERMKNNERISQDLVTKKDAQIETLINFNNKIDDLISVYKMAVINYHYELLWTNDMLWKALKSEKPAFEIFMNDVQRVKNLTL
jgi:hypothetical protein